MGEDGRIRLSVTLSPELAAALREAVASGDYATSGEVVRDALRQWREKRDYPTGVQQLRTRGKEIVIK